MKTRKNGCKASATLVVLGMLGGCASSLEQPIMEDHARSPWFSRSKVNVFSTTAARREVLVKYSNEDNDPFICAEAPPDTADALASSLGLAAQLQAKTKAAAEGEASFSLTKELATSVNTLFTRSQGAQMFRDGAFHLCLALQNKVIQPKEYFERYDDLLFMAFTLTLAEVSSFDSKKAEAVARNTAIALADAQDAAIKARVAQAAVVEELAKLKATIKKQAHEASLKSGNPATGQ